MERASKIPNQSSGVQFEQINPQHVRDLFILKPIHPQYMSLHIDEVQHVFCNHELYKLDNIC